MYKLPCITLPPDLEKALEDYTTSRKKKKSTVVREALEFLFSTGISDHEKEVAIKEAVEVYFSIPKKIPLQSFYIFLYMLAKKQPCESTKEFWGEAVYTHTDNINNYMVFDRIQTLIKAALG